MKERLIEAGLEVELSDVARLLHEKLGPVVTERTGFSPPRQAPAAPDPTPAAGPELGFGETLDETPPVADIWGGNPFDTGRGRYGGPRCPGPSKGDRRRRLVGGGRDQKPGHHAYDGSDDRPQADQHEADHGQGFDRGAGGSWCG